MLSEAQAPQVPAATRSSTRLRQPGNVIDAPEAEQTWNFDLKENSHLNFLLFSTKIENGGIGQLRK